MTVTLSNNGDISNAKCNCVAGASGFYCHVMALLYLIDHTLKLSLESFPRVSACTDNPQQRHKPRTLESRLNLSWGVVSLTPSIRRNDFQKYRVLFSKLDRLLHKIIMVR